MDGTFECVCQTGYETLSASTIEEETIQFCHNIDECATLADDCHADATCTDTEGSWTCDCDPGYTGTGTECEDVLECSGIGQRTKC